MPPSRTSPNAPVDQILGVPPRWVRGWGLWLPTLIVLLFLAFAWLIRYPDEVTASCRISSEAPLSRVFAPRSGILTSIWAAEGTSVSRGQWLGVLDLPGLDQAKGARLARILEKGSPTAPVGPICEAVEELPLEVLALEGPWMALQNACAQWAFLKEPGRKYAPLESLDQQSEKVRSALKALAAQQQLLEEELAVAEQQLTRFQQMFDAHAVSQLELERAQQVFLEKQRLAQRLEEEKWQYRLRQDQLGQERLLTELQQSEKEKEASLAILQQLGRLREMLGGQVIPAPETGVFFPSGFWRTGDFLPQGTPFGAIQPSASNDTIVVELLIATEKRGGIEVGNAVRITLDGFEEGAFGALSDTIHSISNFPSGGFYSARVFLNLPLQTNLNKEIPFREDMTGQARILTSRKRLLERLLHHLRGAFLQ